MSGGSWDYLYQKMNEASASLKASTMPERRAFGELMGRCAKAMHDIEWVDSCDKSEGDEIASIRAALEPVASASILAEAVKDGERIAKRLSELLEEAK